MLLRYYKINPGGNVTAILKADFDKATRVWVAKTILGSDSAIEQVGFWVAPNDSASQARLEMMGGEFCGNATRSLAYLVWREKELPGEFLIESSGVEEAISVCIKEHFAQITLPTKDFSDISKEGKQVVALSGITHVITDEAIDKESARQTLAGCGLLENDAAGVVSVKEENGKTIITPIVWVRDTQTLYAETACASGTLALAYYYHVRDGKNDFTIVQPSGSEFRVTVSDGAITLAGPILGWSEESITIE